MLPKRDAFHRNRPLDGRRGGDISHRQIARNGGLFTPVRSFKAEKISEGVQAVRALAVTSDQVGTADGGSRH
jgi:hypothetical protein